MSVCLFLSASRDRGLSAAEAADLLACVQQLARGVAPLRKLVAHVPAAPGGRDPFLEPESPPVCVMQFYFDDIGHLEAAAGEGGPLVRLLDAEAFPMLAGCDWTQQAMLARPYAVAQPLQAEGAQDAFCTYLVAYEGPADDLHAWLAHYLRHHPPIMARLPDVREVEIYTRIDYCSDLRAQRSNAMQRNKVVFDNAAALARSLNSPVRQELRADFEAFPPFRGASPHYPMQSFIAFA